jgi:hypothetical protein
MYDATILTWEIHDLPITSPLLRVGRRVEGDVHGHFQAATRPQQAERA